MAGLTLVCRLDKDWPVGRKPQENGWLCSYPADERRVVFKEQWGELSLSTYPGYPFAVYETPDFQIAIEGKVYDRSSTTLQSDLNDLVKGLFTGAPDSHRQLAQWVGEADGEFLVIARSKHTPNLAIFSDYLGRLPIYWTRTGDVLLLSRQLEVFVKHLPGVSTDPMGVAQSLLFLYPLGTRTLLRDVKLLTPGSLMLLRPGNNDLELEELSAFNLEEKSVASSGMSGTAAEIARLIQAATLRRVTGGGANVVSLSGGLDSRAVVASLARAKVPVFAATHLDHDRRMLKDVEVARELAAVLGIPWQLYELPPVTGSDALELLHLKGGANSLHMALLLPFLRELNRQHDSKITLFTGDGGDKVLPDLRPMVQPQDLHELVQYVIAENQIFFPEEVEELTNVRAGEVTSELEEILSRYPERDLGQKYVHFLVFERGRRWLFEGEDRNRAILWPTTPFYAPDVFRRCMTTPDALKVNYRLYRKVLAQLSPVVAHVPNASWGVPVDSLGATLRLFLQSVYRSSPFIMRSLFRRYRDGKRGRSFVPGRNASDCLRQMFFSLQETDFFSRNVSGELMVTTRRESCFQTLFTLAALGEWVHCRRSSLESHLKENLF